MLYVSYVESARAFCNYTIRIVDTTDKTETVTDLDALNSTIAGYYSKTGRLLDIEGIEIDWESDVLGGQHCSWPVVQSANVYKGPGRVPTSKLRRI